MPDFVRRRPSRIDAYSAAAIGIAFAHHEVHEGGHYFLEGRTTMADEAVLDFAVVGPSNGKEAHVVFAFHSSLKLDFDLYACSDFDADGTVLTQFGNNRIKAFCGADDTSTSNATVMTDSTASFPVDAFIGQTIHNITDASYGVITDNDATTVTVASLIGGSENDWDSGDQYEINSSRVVIRNGATVNALGILMGGGTGGSGTNPGQGIPGGFTRDNEINLAPNDLYIWRFTSGAAGNDFSWNAEWYEHTDSEE